VLVSTCDIITDSFVGDSTGTNNGSTGTDSFVTDSTVNIFGKINEGKSIILYY
jgi:hypothetical protein